MLATKSVREEVRSQVPKTSRGMRMGEIRNRRRDWMLNDSYSSSLFCTKNERPKQQATPRDFRIAAAPIFENGDLKFENLWPQLLKVMGPQGFKKKTRL